MMTITDHDLVPAHEAHERWANTFPSRTSARYLIEHRSRNGLSEHQAVVRHKGRLWFVAPRVDAWIAATVRAA